MVILGMGLGRIGFATSTRWTVGIRLALWWCSIDGRNRTKLQLRVGRSFFVVCVCVVRKHKDIECPGPALKSLFLHSFVVYDMLSPRRSRRGESLTPRAAAGGWVWLCLCPQFGAREPWIVVGWPLWSLAQRWGIKPTTIADLTN